jgi:hypothetical protein
MNPDPFRRVAQHTARGYAYEVWERRMPRILDATLNCVVYLYRSRHEAEEGINIGGSGFLVSVPTERLPAPASFAFAVTNKHVIAHNACVIRVNTPDRKFDIFELNKANWLVAEHDDLAIAPLPAFDLGRHHVRTVPRDMFLSKPTIAAENVGPGDEVILIGRFINQEGKEQNIPSVRFGHISQMPIEPIEYDGVMQESFLCEIKSIGGFSGSPVFLAPLTDAGRPQGSSSILTKEARLLGVDWAHIQNYECAWDDNGHEIPHIRFPTNTGMMAVVPAWKLNELLDHPEMVRLRQMQEDREIQRRKAPKVATDLSAGVALPATDANPNHREDFTRLEALAARKPAQED